MEHANPDKTAATAGEPRSRGGEVIILENRCIDYAGTIGAMKTAIEAALEYLEDVPHASSKDVTIWFLRWTLLRVAKRMDWQ